MNKTFMSYQYWLVRCSEYPCWSWVSEGDKTKIEKKTFPSLVEPYRFPSLEFSISQSWGWNRKVHKASYFHCTERFLHPLCMKGLLQCSTDQWRSFHKSGLEEVVDFLAMNLSVRTRRLWRAFLALVIHSDLDHCSVSSLDGHISTFHISSIGCVWLVFDHY